MTTNTRRQPPREDPRRRPARRRRSRARRVAKTAAAALCVLGAACGVALLAVALLTGGGAKDGFAPSVEVAAPPMRPFTAPTDTPEPTAEPTPTPEPTLSPEEALVHQSAAPGAEYADPEANRLLTMTNVLLDERDAEGAGGDPIAMGSSADYAALEGVTTFRGSNYRDGGAYGTIPENPTALKVLWHRTIGGLDGWSGVGWTGQAGVVRWPEELRRRMNLNPDKIGKDGLVEAIYATLDGHIYFLDLEDGEPTRPAIDVGAPIKGSLTVDPRGLPLLYCGQGIYDVNGKRVPCGTRVWSLLDQRQLYFLNGQDKAALRGWQAFDCSPLVDGATDTMITCGENGVVYKVKLNTREFGDSIAVNPIVTRYVYQQRRGGKLGTENSVAVYDRYAYFATNIGIIQCLDLNTMQLVWSFDAKDDIDASLVIEPEGDGVVALYGSNELDTRGHYGRCQMFKLNALTGELLWSRDSDVIYQENDNGGGSFATPAVGKGTLSGLVYFHVCRTEKSPGMLYALDKATGETAWVRPMERYGWSSPTCLYTPSGAGYVLLGSSDGALRLIDGLTGDVKAETRLEGNIEGTPAVFGDTLIIGTRDCNLYGIQIR